MSGRIGHGGTKTLDLAIDNSAGENSLSNRRGAGNRSQVGAHHDFERLRRYLKSLIFYVCVAEPDRFEECALPVDG